MSKIIRTYYGTYDITWSAVPIWVWTGIEAHAAVIIASVPAMKYFFRKVLKDSSSSSRLKGLTKYGSGFDRMESATNSEDDQNTKSHYAKNKGSIYVVEDVHLEELLNDKNHDLVRQGAD
jgi:hypothetical protein